MRYTKNSDVIQCAVYNALGVGKQNAISRAELSRITGYKDRRIREAIEAMRYSKVIINLDNGKRVERLNIEDAMRQAVDDTGAEILPFGEEIYPAVFHRRNRGTWLVTMRLEDWIALYKEREAGRDIDSR